MQLARGDDRKANLRRVKSLVRRSAGADIILLSENWLGVAGVPLSEYLSVLEELAGELSGKSLLAAGAQYLEVGRPRLVSRGAFLAPGRGVIGWYAKRFPSQPVGEREFLEPGRESDVVEHQGFKVGALVCVDLFYPELVRRLALQGCQLILNPVSVPQSRRSFWQSLALVRAAENTVFVAVANNTASAYADGREIAGGSLVANPDGTVAAVAGEEETVLEVELDPQAIARVRERWPYLADARELGFSPPR